MKKLVVFDLDGTLVNTLSDIVTSLNVALEQVGAPTLSTPEIQAIIGHSVAYMCQKAIPASMADRWEEVLAGFNAHYGRHCADTSLPYPGILPMLEALKKQGYTLAVVSNKPHRETVKVISLLFPRDLFSLVLGRMNRFTIKPDPAPLDFAISTLGFTRRDTLYVGDSEVDVDFAKNTGVPEIAVDWGYRSHDALLQAGACHIVSQPDAIPPLVESIFSSTL